MALDNLAVAHALLSAMGSGEEPETIAQRFSRDVVVDIPGDVGAFPWIGHDEGRDAVARFFRDLHDATETLRFEVDDVLANDDRAVILGRFASRVHRTGRTIESAFAIVLTTADGAIAGFRFFEDSYAVSRAARP